MKNGKVWGVTELLLKTALVELHRLTIKRYASCSLHKHEFRWNGFLVLEGKLWIQVHKNDYKLIDETELGPGEFMTVRPNEFHCFVTKGLPAKAIEIYYPQELTDDIVRKTVGKLTKR